MTFANYNDWISFTQEGRCPPVREAVLESWKRSRQSGLSPQMFPIKKASPEIFPRDEFFVQINSLLDFLVKLVDKTTRLGIIVCGNSGEVGSAAARPTPSSLQFCYSLVAQWRFTQGNRGLARTPVLGLNTCVYKDRRREASRGGSGSAGGERMKRKTKTSLMQQMLPRVDQVIDMIAHLEEKTGYGYRKSLLSFITYLEKCPAKSTFPRTLKQKTIAGWARHLNARYSFDTVTNSMRIVARFLSFLESEGVLVENPVSYLLSGRTLFCSIVRTFVCSNLREKDPATT